MEPIGETLEAPKQTMIIAARAAGIIPLGFMGTVADFKDLELFRQVGDSLGMVVQAASVAMPRNGIVLFKSDMDVRSSS